jgi:torulene dioxygenase
LSDAKPATLNSNMSQTQTQTQKASTSRHVNDWPNDAGFQVDVEQRKPIALRIVGSFPSGVAGTLIRTGPASYRTESKEGEFRLSHWFDGWSHVYRFQLLPQANGTCRVLYNSRRQVDEQLARVKQTGRLDGITFGQKRDPCEGFFAKVKSVFAARNSGLPGDMNIGVTIHPAGPDSAGESSGGGPDKQHLTTRTDSAQLKRIHAQTLEPMGVTDQSKLHPELNGPMSCAHAQFDPKTGDCYNYNLAFGRFATYKLFRTSASSGKTEILATITGADVSPAYVHSFFLTESCVVLCVWTAHYAAGGLATLWQRNLLDAISPFDAKAQTHWFVVDRKSGKGLLQRFTSHAMFCFHTINAHERKQPDGTVDILADLNEYPSLDILHRLYYDNLVSDSPGARAYADKGRAASTKPRFARYKLSGISLQDAAAPTTTAADIPKALRILHLPASSAGELPTINPLNSTKAYRYAYGLCDRGQSSFLDGLVKVDLQTRQTVYWTKAKHTPGEAIFVVDPARKGKEDGGWLLSCVLNGATGTSYLLCLDAETMREIGRAESDVAWGIGFHGQHAK